MHPGPPVAGQPGGRTSRVDRCRVGAHGILARPGCHPKEPGEGGDGGGGLICVDRIMAIRIMTTGISHDLKKMYLPHGPL